MDSDDPWLHDHSTSTGKCRLFLSRLSWKWILPGIFFLGLMAWSFVDTIGGPSKVDSESDNSTAMQLLQYLSSSGVQKTDFPAGQRILASFTFSKGKLKATGREYNPLMFPSMTAIPNLDKDNVTEVLLKNVKVDAGTLSEALEGCRNLRKIQLEKVTISGNFSRVYLPSLKEFQVNIVREEEEDSAMLRLKKDPEKLRNLLFFDIDPDQEWTLPDLIGMGKNITISVGGTLLLKINREAGIVNLNVRYCKEFLNVTAGELENSPITDLTLSWCKITNASIPDDVRKLNLNNAVPQRVEMTRILQKSSSLEEFHALLPYLCENTSWISPKFPELQVPINFVDFSPLIRTVSISKLQPISVPLQASPVRSLAIEQSNVTGLLDNLDVIFPNLTRFALFNQSHSKDAYKLLDKALNMDSVEWILMERFLRVPEGPAEEKVDNFLTVIGIPELANNFLVERVGNQRGKVWKGREISDFERNYYRFNLFGFNQVDTYHDYLIYDSKVAGGYIGPPE